MGNESPAFQFYASDDWLSSSDVCAMTMEERGAYMTLVAHYWRDNGLPNDTSRLARLCHATLDVFERWWPAIKQAFADGENGTLRLLWLDERQRKAKEFSKKLRDAGVNGAAKRWAGHGEAIATPIANPMASDASSSSSSSSSSKDKDTSPDGEATQRSKEQGTGLEVIPERNAKPVPEPFRPKHPDTPALAQYHAKAARFWKADVRINPSSERSLKGYDGLLGADGRTLLQAKAVLDWLFGGMENDYKPTPKFDWRPNVLSGATLREQWDRLEAAMTAPKEEYSNGFKR